MIKRNMPGEKDEKGQSKKLFQPCQFTSRIFHFRNHHEQNADRLKKYDTAARENICSDCRM